MSYLGSKAASGVYQKIIAKRKAQRWKEKFASLPPAERLAIMVALGEVDQM
ncbi:hypothetical protein [Citrobacter freundii]|uniref:hypothetical protein n=1 Tax=Citrobacter freundii TaxID=546 RepID=UPI003C12FAF5